MFEQIFFSPGQSKTKLSFDPDLFWIKNLEQGSHFLVDNTVANKTLSFDTDSGYIDHEEGIIVNNKPAMDFSSYIAAFDWKTKFMSKVSYVGDGTHGRTLYHNLKSNPEFILIKNTSNQGDWIAWHYSFGFRGYLKFNTDDGFIADKMPLSDKIPNQHAFYVGNLLNRVGNDYMSYVFGFSENFCTGFYEGKENNFIKTKNRPDLLIIKSVLNTGSWRMFSKVFNPGDSLRINSFGGLTKDDDTLKVNLSDDGFFIEKTSPALNSTKAKYIYLAFTQV